MKGLNVRQICKQIKASKNNILWWQTGFNYFITNRHWLLRLPIEEIPQEILIQLFSIFAEIPDEGRILQKYCDNIRNDAEIPKDVDSIIYSNLQRSLPGQITPFVRVGESNRDPSLRLIQYTDENGKVRIIYANDDYIRMADIDHVTAFCSGTHSPIFFQDGVLVILPVRRYGQPYDMESKFIIDIMMAETAAFDAAK